VLHQLGTFAPKDPGPGAELLFPSGEKKCCKSFQPFLSPFIHFPLLFWLDPAGAFPNCKTGYKVKTSPSCLPS